MMPYETLPERLRALIPSSEGQEIFRRTFNSQLADGKTEEVAFASAWASLQRAGYERGEDGKWMKKTQPTAAQVHVDGAEWDDEEKGRKKPKDYYKGADVEKAEYQGRTVTLDKPFRLPAGSSKKFGVYVKDGDRVKRVTFGDPNMDIRRDDPQARANFRARHSCDTATDKTTARYWSCRMWTAGATVSDTVKRMMNDDSFTHAAEAAVRSMDLGLEGRIHVHQTADGQAVYMPGETHDEYLAQMATHADIRDSLLEEMEEGAESSPDLLQRAISAIIDAVMEHDLTKASDILKIDRARRIVWGWASVSTIKGEIVTDLQGDRIAPAEMEKMADRFMRSARAAKAMHDGDDVGEVLHSFPVTEKLAKAFGIAIDREGWITGTYIKSDDEWAKVLRGEYRGLSIGGRAKRRKA
jgi:cation transport regulator ChaB